MAHDKCERAPASKKLISTATLLLNVNKKIDEPFTHHAQMCENVRLCIEDAVTRTRIHHGIFAREINCPQWAGGEIDGWGIESSRG